MFDMLTYLCDPKLSNRDIELKLFGHLKNKEASQYLLIFRKEIVSYLHATKFWEQKP
jgi:hypothetical protein